MVCNRLTRRYSFLAVGWLFSLIASPTFAAGSWNLIHGHTCSGEVLGRIVCTDFPPEAFWRISESDSPSVSPGEAIRLAMDALEGLNLGYLGGDSRVEQVNLVPCGVSGWHYIVVFRVTQQCTKEKKKTESSVSVAVLMDKQVVLPSPKVQTQEESAADLPQTKH